MNFPISYHPSSIYNQAVEIQLATTDLIRKLFITLIVL